MLYIISERYFLSDYIFEALKGNSDITIITCETVRHHGLARFPWLMMRYVRSNIFNCKGFYASGIFPRKFLDEIKAIGPDDIVLLFSFQNLKNLMVLNKELGPCRKILFLWNPLHTINRSRKEENKYARAIRESGIRACTFDSRDARRYGFGLVPQVYRRPGDELLRRLNDISENRLFEADFFFVGVDKNRQEKLTGFMRQAELEGLKGHLHLIHDRRSAGIPGELARYYRTENMPYADYLDTLTRSRAMLEILQPGQTGMTMRTLEALFLNRKLITDNAEACDFPFYHPDNIYIIGRDNGRPLREFLASPLRTVPRDITSQHDITVWLGNLLDANRMPQLS